MLQPIKNWWLDNRLLVALAVSVAIVVLSLVPPTVMPHTGITVSDKFLHSLAYMVLLWVWLLVYKDRKRLQTGIILILSLTIFGIILEVLQGALTTYRTPDVLDALADLVGLILGFISFQLLYQYIFDN